MCQCKTCFRLEITKFGFDLHFLTAFARGVILSFTFFHFIFFLFRLSFQLLPRSRLWRELKQTILFMNFSILQKLVLGRAQKSSGSGSAPRPIFGLGPYRAYKFLQTSGSGPSGFNFEVRAFGLIGLGPKIYYVENF